MLFLAVILVVGLGMVFGAVSLNALAAADAITIRELDDRLAEQQRAYELLVAEVAQLEDPERIRKAAEGLGMVPATTPRYVLLDRSLPTDGEQPMAEDDVKPMLSANR